MVSNNMEIIGMAHDFVLNAACKGFPLAAKPCAVSHLGDLGWNLLADELAPDYSVQGPPAAIQAKARLQMNLAPKVPTVSVDAFLLRRSPTAGYRR